MDWPFHVQVLALAIVHDAKVYVPERFPLVQVRDCEVQVEPNVRLPQYLQRRRMAVLATADLRLVISSLSGISIVSADPAGGVVRLLFCSKADQLPPPC
jgi:hypothetical protein